MMNDKVVFDFDGTLFQYYWGEDYDDRLITLKPDMLIAQMAALLYSMNKDIYICSAVRSSREAEVKRRMVIDVLPMIDDDHCLFPYSGLIKSEMFHILLPGDILIDDFSENLRHWPAIAVKYYNGINGTKGTWEKSHGPYISYDMDAMDAVNIVCELQK